MSEPIRGNRGRGRGRGRGGRGRGGRGRGGMARYIPVNSSRNPPQQQWWMQEEKNQPYEIMDGDDSEEGENMPKRGRINSPNSSAGEKSFRAGNGNGFSWIGQIMKDVAADNVDSLKKKS